MMMKCLFIISNLLNTMFMSTKNPVMMIMIIILQTIIVCMLTGSLMESFWTSYIMMLIFLGGMMVLFIYITSIASNEMLYFNYKYMSITAMMTVFMMMKNKENYEMNNSEMNMLIKNLFNMEMSESMKLLYNQPMLLMSIMMMMYLFLTLMVVVYITELNNGPIRKMN
uniref:NADH-ubiquinone oxidoreductase chain 6 n=1 Tax=Paramastax nigra TaxID=1260743 RepID=M4JDU4_9ORTH|nr:NADH dehydrogenase subunit 6 [Paramastax nigra]